MAPSLQAVAMTDKRLSHEFLRNRAELLPDDVWGQYIVPPLFNRRPVFGEPKSLRIQGGRGCGKTMFLRYLCHPSRFSVDRKLVPATEFEHVGLFWRPDIQFCALMREEWLGERDSQAAFLHYATLIIIGELARAFDSIAHADLEGGPCDLRSMPLPPSVIKYLGGEVEVVSDLKDFSLMERQKLDEWVQNPSVDRPMMRRFDYVVEPIAEAAGQADPRLRKLFFRIFVDEFENLQETQRRLICDYVKHPRKVFNICFAMRQHAITQFRTSGQEQIVENHDVFTIDLELELGNEEGRDFQLLAAEFLLKGISKSRPEIDFGAYFQKDLFDETALKRRLSDSYRTAVLSTARGLLPQLTAPDIAKHVLADSALRKRLLDMIEKGLKMHGATELKAENFIVEASPEASIIAGALVNRARQKPDQVLDRMKSLMAGKDESAFFDQLIVNNLYGCLFYLYIGLPRRRNLLYAGFDRFCALASPNLRYFQQLCQLALAYSENEVDTRGTGAVIPVSPEIQAAAAQSVGEVSLQEVERLGLMGPRLKDMMLRLGRLFAAAHRRPSQSEVEINHFSIDVSDRTGLTAETEELIRQAKIWSVFYEEQDTKNKSDSTLAQTDIIPNPIFSPHFRISYRKKKKLTLSAEEVNKIATGTGEQFTRILKQYSDHWRSDEDEEDQTGSLF